MTLLATYESPLGNIIELHYENGRFWTEIHDEDNNRTMFLCNKPEAYENYEYAQRYGKLHSKWPEVCENYAE